MTYHQLTQEERYLITAQRMSGNSPAAIARLLGANPQPPPVPEAVLGAAVARNAGREQAIRVRLERRDGRAVAFPNGPQGSHMVTSLIGADALALIPKGEGKLEAGTAVALEHLPH